MFKTYKKLWDLLLTQERKLALILLILMIVFGFLGEIDILPLHISTALGFVFFYLSFKLIYDEYAIKSKSGKNVFWVLGTVWSLYGVAAVMPLTLKNVSYNFLDVISKNFYGLFIYIKIKQLALE